MILCIAFTNTISCKSLFITYVPPFIDSIVVELLELISCYNNILFVQTRLRRCSHSFLMFFFLRLLRIFRRKKRTFAPRLMLKIRKITNNSNNSEAKWMLDISIALRPSLLQVILPSTSFLYQYQIYANTKKANYSLNSELRLEFGVR